MLRITPGRCMRPFDRQDPIPYLRLSALSAANVSALSAAQAQEHVGGNLGAVGGRSFGGCRLREQLIEMRLPSAGKQIVVADIGTAQKARHRGDEHVVLDEAAAVG